MKKYAIYSNTIDTTVSQWDILPILIQIVAHRFETIGCDYLKAIKEVNIIADSLRDDLIANGYIEYHGTTIEECD